MPDQDLADESVPDPAANDNADSTPASGRLRVTLRCLLRLPYWLLTLLWLLGFGVRLTVLDAYQPLAVVFYASPLAVLFGCAALLAVWSYRLRYRKLPAAWLALSLVCGAWWHGATYHTNELDPAPHEIKAVFWNVNRGFMGWPRIAAEVERFDAPLIALVEAIGDVPQRAEFWKRRFPDHEAIPLSGGFVVLVRGQLKAKQGGLLGSGLGDSGGRFRMLELVLQEKRVTLVLVDVRSSPLMPRRRPLEWLNTVLDSAPDGPVIVMGDFNTPTDSVLLRPLRENYKNAFEIAGHGLDSTWPVPCPVLALDQVWGNRHVVFHRCRLDWSWLSDHRPVVTEFSVSENRLTSMPDHR